MVFCVSYRRHLYWYVVADDHFALLSLLQLWIYVCNPCCFLMFNSYLFGVVSFPFKNIQVQQRKKNFKYCSMQLFSIARKRQNPKLIGIPNRLYRDKNEASLKTWRKKSGMRCLKNTKICQRNPSKKKQKELFSIF